MRRLTYYYRGPNPVCPEERLRGERLTVGSFDLLIHPKNMTLGDAESLKLCLCQIGPLIKPD